MTTNAKKITMWIGGSIVGGGAGLTVIAMALQFWISTEVKSQLDEQPTIVVPDVTQLTTDVEVMKSIVTSTNEKVDAALNSQQRFEERFIDYLDRESRR